MSAGIQPTQASVNSAAGSAALNLRSAFQAVVNLQDWLGTQTNASLVALGFTTGDAAVIISTIGNLNTLAGVYAGAAPGSAFNYQANSFGLWGGQ